MQQPQAPEKTGAPNLERLSEARPGARGVIAQVVPGDGEAARELERRLLEFGFVEGATVRVLHEGAIGHDPIAVRVDDTLVALRRHDAAGVWVDFESAR